jgi:hypothetical protein
VTNFWEHGAAKEVEDGKRLTDAVKAGGVKLFVWSGLEPVSKISKGKYTKVEHFDTKVSGGGGVTHARAQNSTNMDSLPSSGPSWTPRQAEILEYAKSQGVPIVDVQPAMYMENFLGMMGPRKVRAAGNPYPPN